MFQSVCIAKGGFADGFKDRDILEPDLNNSNLSNGTWSLAVEMMDKAENMSAMANMTEWNGSLLNMETEESGESGESGNDTMNDTDNKSSMHGHGADARTGNMALEHLDQYDNESVNDSENDPAKCHRQVFIPKAKNIFKLIVPAIE